MPPRDVFSSQKTFIDYSQDEDEFNARKRERALREAALEQAFVEKKLMQQKEQQIAELMQNPQLAQNPEALMREMARINPAYADKLLDYQIKAPERELNAAYKNALMNRMTSKGGGGNSPRPAGGGNPVNAPTPGQEQLSYVLQSQLKNFDKLNNMGAAVSTQKGLKDNISAGLRATSIGQMVARKTGSEEQVVRDSIKNQRQLLLRSMKSAAGISASEINSNAELKNMLDTFADPETPYETAYEIAQNIDEIYGTGSLRAPERAMGNTEADIFGGAENTLNNAVGAAESFVGTDNSRERNMATQALSKARTESQRQRIRQAYRSKTGEEL